MSRASVMVLKKGISETQVSYRGRKKVFLLEELDRFSPEVEVHVI